MIAIMREIYLQGHRVRVKAWSKRAIYSEDKITAGLGKKGTVRKYNSITKLAQTNIATFCINFTTPHLEVLWAMQSGDEMETSAIKRDKCS